MLTPDELAALQDISDYLSSGADVALVRAGRVVATSSDPMLVVSQNAHSAIAKLLKREELEQEALEPLPNVRIAQDPQRIVRSSEDRSDDPFDELVAKIVFNILNTIDRSEVWHDARANPHSYRQAVEIVFRPRRSK